MIKQIKTVCINTSPGKNQQQMEIRRRSFGRSLLSEPHKIILYYLQEITNKQTDDSSALDNLPCHHISFHTMQYV
jgi:hypothetical protein